jgi:hypothetical protein
VLYFLLRDTGKGEGGVLSPRGRKGARAVARGGVREDVCFPEIMLEN